jgi:hypothetical protein
VLIENVKAKTNESINVRNNNTHATRKHVGRWVETVDIDWTTTGRQLERIRIQTVGQD